MYIPYTHERVVRKSAATVYLVVFVDIHNRTADLFAPRGAGQFIRDIPFEELARLDYRSPLAPA